MANWKRCAKHGKNYDADKYPDGCYNCTHPDATPKQPTALEKADAFEMGPQKTDNYYEDNRKFTFALTAVQQATKIMEIKKGEVVDHDKISESIFNTLMRLAK